MAKEYKKENIINTYFTIAILDDCFKIHGEIYDEINKLHTPQNLIDACKRVIELYNDDRERRKYDKGEIVWDYRVIKHEEDDSTDWQTAYKVYKYKGRWKFYRDDNF